MPAKHSILSNHFCIVNSDIFSYYGVHFFSLHCLIVIFMACSWSWAKIINYERKAYGWEGNSKRPTVERLGLLIHFLRWEARNRKQVANVCSVCPDSHPPCWALGFLAGMTFSNWVRPRLGVCRGTGDLSCRWWSIAKHVEARWSTEKLM